MENENMEQNTQRWLEWRATGIGASDAPIIMGKSKWKTPRQLWHEKVYKDIKENSSYIKEKGHYTESFARSALELKYNMSFPPVTMTCAQFPFIRASLDGYNKENKIVVEIKLLGKELFDNLANEKLPLLKRIPGHYFDQLMQQYFVAQPKTMILCGVTEFQNEDGQTDRKFYPLVFDPGDNFDSYVQNQLVPKLFQFWDMVQKQVPPPLSRDDVLEVDNAEFSKLLNKYADLQIAEKTARADVKKISDKIARCRENIISSEWRSHSNIVTADGFKIKEREGTTRVDYEAAFNAVQQWLVTLKTLAPDQIVNAIMSVPDVPNLTRYSKTGERAIVITVPKKRPETKTETVPETETVEISAPKTAEISAPAENVTHEPHDEKKDAKNEINPESAPIEPSDALAFWRNPLTGKIPRYWAGKSNMERVTYLERELKRARKLNAPDSVLTEISNVIFSLKTK